MTTHTAPASIPVFFPGEGPLEALLEEDGTVHRLSGRVERGEGVYGREVLVLPWNTRVALGEPRHARLGGAFGRTSHRSGPDGIS